MVLLIVQAGDAIVPIECLAGDAIVPIECLVGLSFPFSYVHIFFYDPLPTTSNYETFLSRLFVYDKLF